jgi:hypothetical protein
LKVRLRIGVMMGRVNDGLSQEEYELSDEVVLICCWCGGEKRRTLWYLIIGLKYDDHSVAFW